MGNAVKEINNAVLRNLTDERDRYKADTERLDKLQELTTGYGKGWMLRMSSTGRGLRLHETSRDGAVKDVRQAIDLYIAALAKIKEG